MVRQRDELVTYQLEFIPFREIFLSSIFTQLMPVGTIPSLSNRNCIAHDHNIYTITYNRHNLAVDYLPHPCSKERVNSNTLLASGP